MESSLVSTKFYIPPARPGLVTRPRLVDRLKANQTNHLVLVSAPAGFGKTTLLAEWARQNQPSFSTAWLSLETAENDSLRFWEYFVAALKTLKQDVGVSALSLLHFSQPVPTETMLTSLINDLANIERDFYLVLDDYHFIQSQQIHSGVTFLLEHMPAKMHLVIATRVDPPLPLSHFRGKGTLSEIGANDLRFTLDEATGLFSQLQGHALSPEDIQLLNSRAEGWAVGLKMAALSLGQEKDIKSFIDSFSGSQRLITDYLLEEVLQGRTRDVRDFLLKTSVLERLTAPLCDFVGGYRTSREMLVKLEQANLFIVPLDESRQWYRYHHLFGDLLRQQLGAEYGAEAVRGLHRKASQWYEKNGLPDNAIRHALTAREWESAIRIIGFIVENRLHRGEFTTLFDWLRQIPDEVLRTRPRLHGTYAGLLITFGQFEAAQHALSYLEKTVAKDTGIRGEVAFYQTFLAFQQRDAARLVEWANKALASLPPNNSLMRARVNYFLGLLSLRRFQLEDAWHYMTDTYEMARQIGDTYNGAGGAYQLSRILLLRGRLTQAFNMAQKAIELAGQSPAAAFPHHILASILYEQNDVQRAVKNVQIGIRLNEFSRNAEGQVNAYYILVKKHLIEGDASGVSYEMENADTAAIHGSVSPDSLAMVAANHILVAIQQDDLTAASIWGKKLAEFHLEGAPLLIPELQSVPARLLIAQGEIESAEKQLGVLYDQALRAEALGCAIKIRVYQALAAPKPAQALALLVEALKMGQPEGFVRTFVDEGKLLTPLLRKALSRGIMPEYTAMLLGIIEDEERQRATRTGKTPSSSSVTGVLSEREVEVLLLVSREYSNQSIAEKLCVSTGTVKTHLHHIINKLEVRDRRQAVIKARELKLL